MDYYKEKGPIQKIAKHGLFENFTLFIIFVNAIWIGVDTDYNYAEEIQYADMHYRVMENAFCTYFSAEVAWLQFSAKISADFSSVAVLRVYPRVATLALQDE